jgi:hypothetical protein
MPGHHFEEQIGGAGLIALKNGVGKRLKAGVLANLVSGH